MYQPRIVILPLKELALNTVIANLNKLGDLGDLAEEFVRKILQSCSPEQLFQIEERTLKELDTEQYWKLHCKNKLQVTEKTSRTWRQTFIDTEKRRLQELERRKKSLEKKLTEEARKRESSQTQIINTPSSIPSARRFSSTPSSNSSANFLRTTSYGGVSKPKKKSNLETNPQMKKILAQVRK